MHADKPHAADGAEVLASLQAAAAGLSRAAIAERLAKFGPNALPHARPTPLVVVFVHQFLSPLIYVLMFAAALSVALGEYSDAAIIVSVLLVNAIIGTLQEYNAQRSAEALRALTVSHALVVREGESLEVPAEEVVPGDIVLLETGAKVPADLRLLTASSLEIEESLLTGESLASAKDATVVLPGGAALGDRANMAFAGTLVTRGRARGVATATGSRTELGRIADLALGRAGAKPPLLVRMESFTRRISIAMGFIVLLVALVEIARGRPVAEVFMVAVALAVAAIPEGLPVALTVALAIGMRRMARVNVIVRKLVAVEALGSCTFIASDKTGTLTMNQLTVRRLALPNQSLWEVTGEGAEPTGEVLPPPGADVATESVAIERLARAVSLCNEAFLGRRDGRWTHHGDAVDVSLLVLAHKLGITRATMETACPQLAAIPFESARQFAATLNRSGERKLVSVKGALERVLPMCANAAAGGRENTLDAASIERQAHELAQAGYRVLAVAEGEWVDPVGAFAGARLSGLTFLGLVATIDPLRPDARDAVARCRDAGVEVAMVTGDHPLTALAIARELGLAQSAGQVVTGPQLREAGEGGLAGLVAGARVFARVEPEQKLLIVKALAAAGHFVAVTGDGANDAPALRAAHVGVAMGRSGTDIARESAQLVLTDDAFSSIVAGIEQGRIAYSNVRKVIFLLVSTGAGELVLFLLAIAFGSPMPLLPVQLLWLNLVTNGIQDVALAFEPGEGDELRRPPRPPREKIFNAPMLWRVGITGVVIGGLGFGAWSWLLGRGYDQDAARNVLLLLLVLFENIQIGNCRSETRSAFTINPFSNRILIASAVAALGLHIAAMNLPGISTLLRLQPVSLEAFGLTLLLALALLPAMEAYKLFARAAMRRPAIA